MAVEVGTVTLREVLAQLGGITRAAVGIIMKQRRGGTFAPFLAMGGELEHMSRRNSNAELVLGLCLAVAAASGAAARQQSNSPVPAVDVERVGPQIGEPIPEFSLRDQNGHVQSLKSLFGPKGAIIVFFRSADW